MRLSSSNDRVPPLDLWSSDCAFARFYHYCADRYANFTTSRIGDDQPKLIQKDWIPETLALESLAVTVGETILLGESRVQAREFSLVVCLQSCTTLRSFVHPSMPIGGGRCAVNPRAQLADTSQLARRVERFVLRL